MAAIGSVGAIAQLVERVVRNDEAWGSNPHTSSLRFEARKAEAVTPEQRVGGLCFALFLSASKTTAWQASRLRSNIIANAIHSDKVLLRLSLVE